MPAGFTSAKFVGRDSAFARFAPALEATAAGVPTTVLVEGTGGVGVSRFLTEATERLTALADPFAILRGRAVPAGDDEPYAPILRAIRATLLAAADEDLADLLGPGIEDMLRLVPELHTRLGRSDALLERPTVTAPERRQARLLEGILGVLSRLGERQPVVVILEDLHHADAGTRAFATFLARVQLPRRVCLVATFQPDEITRSHPLTDDIAAMMAARRPAERLPLEPLGRDELADLVEAIEGERPTGSALVLVAERSAGVPLVAEEVLAARRELSRASLPGSFDDLVIARLGLRSPECRRVLRLVAPAGRPLTMNELADVAAAYERTADHRPPPRSTSMPRRSDGPIDADLAAGLAEAVEHGILAVSDEGVDFRHELVGRAVVADLLPGQRHRHHLALAAGLVAHPASAARHWAAANATRQARDAAIEAAGRAEAVYAPRDALDHLELALSSNGPPSHDGANGSNAAGGEDALDATPLQVRAAEAAFATGRSARSLAYVEAVIASLDERSDRVVLGLLYERLGRYRRSVGDLDGALAALRRAVSLVPSTPSVERATVLAALSQVRMLDGTFSEAESLAREAIAVATEVGPEAHGQLVHATTTLGVSLGWGEDPEEGVALLRQALHLAEEMGDHDELFRVYANLTTVLDLVGRREEAVDVAYDGVEATRQAGLEAVYGNFLRGNAADSLFQLGRWPESRALSATALEWSPGGVTFVNSIDSLAVIEIETHAGELAGRLLGQLLLELETVRDAQHATPVYRSAASFALWRNDHADARRAAERGWALVHESEDWSLIAKMAATVAEVDAMAGAEARRGRDLAVLANARTRTRTVLAEAEAAVQRSGVSDSIGSRREADANLRTAASYRARLEGRDDPEAWSHVAGLWAALGNPYAVARARWREAEAHLGSGEGRAARARARAPLEEAAEIGIRLAARPMLRELRELAGRALIRLPDGIDQLIADGMTDDEAEPVAVGPGHAGDDRNGNGEGPREPSALVRGVVGEAKPARADTFGLSRREHEVLALISEGRTNREIGERLFISQKTVGVHVGNILAKLGVSGRVEAAAVAIRLGLSGQD
ncbi:MAG TPA: LuxR C-terminal-related transcriptional regulator [Candidatus Limnocylindrales bacterium]|nr:LuxR C-terminal-related transcriptional regulator [Candidatus Limnocylindrales bacterium]